jgi:hypothetical protein
MLEITFSVKAWEYFEGLLISSLKRIFPRVGFLAFPIIMLIGLFGVLGLFDDPWILAASALAASAVLFLLLAIVPAWRALQSGRDPQRSAPTTWRISDQRITVSTGRGDAKVNWKTFERPIQTPHLFLLHSAADKRSIYILPKRAFQDGAQRERFRQMAIKAYGKFF